MRKTDYKAGGVSNPQFANSRVEFVPVIIPGYGPLMEILHRAYAQAATGKGKERHANELPFVQQPILVETRALGIGFPAGQARKKVLEAANAHKDHKERAVADLLGAINYIAAAIIYIEEGN